MAEITPTNGLSPLDQVRLVEAEMARKAVAAREAAEDTVEKAREQALLLKKQAEEDGKTEGNNRKKAMIDGAQQQAGEINAQAQREANELHEKGQVRMEQAVFEAVRVVLGMKEGGRI